MIYDNLTDLSDPALRFFVSRTETELYHAFEPEPGVFLAESALVAERALSAGYEPLSALVCREMCGQAEIQRVLRLLPDQIPVYTAPETVLRGIAGYPLTRGLLLAMRRRVLPPVPELLDGASRIAVLERVMNPTNVGAIFRNAAAFGLDAVILTEGSADPLYRRAIRVSMGNVFSVPWTFARGETEALIRRLREQGFFTAALALCADSISITDPALQAVGRLALVLGSEGPGLSDCTIQACDAAVRIPMAPGVDSLNVAAASAVAFWEAGKGAV